MSKILFTTPIIEYPAAGGPQLRIEASIKALSLVSEVHILVRSFKYVMGGDVAEKFYKMITPFFKYCPSVKNISPNRYIRKLQRIVKKISGTSDADFIIDYAKKNKIKIIWFGYGNISFPIIKEIKEKAPFLQLVCDTDSVWSRFVLRELPFEKNNKRRDYIKLEGQKKELEEKEWVNLCEVTTAVSEVDASYYRGLANEPDRVRLFSNVIDMDSYNENEKIPNNFIKPCIYLAGGFGPLSAMDKAARWVIKDILPILKEKIPNIHFYIVGSGSIETLSDIKDRNITITGKLPSVLPYLCNANVALVPLMFESGTRYKILEAGACKIPIVSTTLGAEGLSVSHGKDILIADTVENFSDCIIKCINDKEYAKEIANKCYELVMKDYSVEKLKEEAIEILHHLGKK
jgi:polysaccharide biosynthesis protein PslH